MPKLVWGRASIPDSIPEVGLITYPERGATRKEGAYRGIQALWIGFKPFFDIWKLDRKAIHHCKERPIDAGGP